MLFVAAGRAAAEYTQRSPPIDIYIRIGSTLRSIPDVTSHRRPRSPADPTHIGQPEEHIKNESSNYRDTCTSASGPVLLSSYLERSARSSCVHSHDLTDEAAGGRNLQLHKYYADVSRHPPPPPAARSSSSVWFRTVRGENLEGDLCPAVDFQWLKRTKKKSLKILRIECSAFIVLLSGVVPYLRVRPAASARPVQLISASSVVLASARGTARGRR
ncbi:hypothetical protein EVAR_87005_1 [Eumeta japonica]|uniref:Uncharacterized protein n=1 Tax=Eumeta variegata TaxID=151549 RepID=A0A4C1W6Q9_EUMVA|nr:hypothetical protein EVAR_87005_1 [Eumeta japonica]